MGGWRVGRNDFLSKAGKRIEKQGKQNSSSPLFKSLGLPSGGVLSTSDLKL
jgi:hypothetical protein